MKSLITLLFLLSSFAFARIENNGDLLEQNFTFDGSQLDGEVHLQHDIQEPVWGEKEIDSTCTRQVPDGFETKCHTEYDEKCESEYKCNTEYEQECSTRYENKCRTRYEQRCRTEYEQECRTEHENRCRTEYVEKCESRNERHCETRNEQECKTEHHRECRQEWRCPTRPGTQCRNEEVCEDKPTQECRTVPRENCQDIPRRECHQVPEQRCESIPHERCERVPRERCEQHPIEECHSEPVQECHQVPKQKCGYEQVCHDIPKQVCKQVQKWKTETYACKKTIPVQVGTQRKLLITGDAQIKFTPLPADVKVADEFQVALKGDENEDPTLELKILKDSGAVIYYDTTESKVETGDKLKAVKGLWLIDIVGLESLVAPIKAGIQQLRVEEDALKFSIGKVLEPEFLTLAIDLSRKSGFGGGYSPVSKTALKGNEVLLKPAGDRTEVSIPLSTLAKQAPLKKGNHKAIVTIAVGDPGKKPLNKAAVPTLKAQGDLEFKLK